jgi:hypothetical protein
MLIIRAIWRAYPYAHACDTGLQVADRLRTAGGANSFSQVRNGLRGKQCHVLYSSGSSQCTVAYGEPEFG